MDSGSPPRQAQRSVLLVLRRTVSGHNVHGSNATKAAVLRVQYDNALFPHHTCCPAWILRAERLGRESFHGHHDPAVDDRIPDARCREHATHVGRAATSW